MIYEPREDSHLLARNLKNYVKGKSFLDMGTGSAFQSEQARINGAASILAVDIEEESVALARKKGFMAQQSDLFKSVKGTFDVIAFNPPYLPFDEQEDPESRRNTTGGKKGDELSLKFIKALPQYLNKKGVALLVVSSLAPFERMERTLKQEGFTKRVIDTFALFMEKLELWEIRIKQQ